MFSTVFLFCWGKNVCVRGLFLGTALKIFKYKRNTETAAHRRSVAVLEKSEAVINTCSSQCSDENNGVGVCF